MKDEPPLSRSVTGSGDVGNGSDRLLDCAPERTASESLARRRSAFGRGAR